MIEVGEYVRTVIGSIGKVTKIEENKFLYGEFPKNFCWSVATAAYQVRKQRLTLQTLMDS